MARDTQMPYNVDAVAFGEGVVLITYMTPEDEAATVMEQHTIRIPIEDAQTEVLEVLEAVWLLLDAGKTLKRNPPASFTR